MLSVDISIHALVKRATVSAIDGIVGHDISIHALVKRATHALRVEYVAELISIHALVKRATFKKAFSTVIVKDFNPRPREEGD